MELLFVNRTGYSRIIRNCLIAAGNSKNTKLKKYVLKHLNSTDNIIRAASIWSLGKLLKLKEFNKLKKQYEPEEKDLSVKSEWYINASPQNIYDLKASFRLSFVSAS